jgi:oligogalacturonide lyase
MEFPSFRLALAVLLYAAPLAFAQTPAAPPPSPPEDNRPIDPALARIKTLLDVNDAREHGDFAKARELLLSLNAGSDDIEVKTLLATVNADLADASKPKPAPVAAASTSAPATASAAAATKPDDMPTDWVDPVTGHRVIRLSREDNTQSLYFNQNPFTPDGTRLVVTVPNGIATINLKTREIKQIAFGQAPTQRVDTHDDIPVELRLGHLVVGRKTPTVYYTNGADVLATNLDTSATRKICTLPPELVYGSGFTVNADETLLVGSGDAVDGPLGAIGPRWTGNKELGPRMAALVPMVLYSINIQTGELKKFFRAEHDWLNHVQFSPTDPKLLMYCHEGTWGLVDRIWQINLDGEKYTVKNGDTLDTIATAHGTYAAMLKFNSNLTSDEIKPGQVLTIPPTPRLMHQRTMANEIAGHEFWGADGKDAYYDLQTPESQVFWLGRVNVATGQRTWYSLPKNEWSVHYNVSPDGTLYAGDGGGPTSVARGDNGQFIFLFTPDPSTAQVVKVGHDDVTQMKFKAEKLVDLSKHDYGLEPNVMFTPDMKWIVFRSNILGLEHGSQVLAVEIAKAQK